MRTRSIGRLAIALACAAIPAFTAAQPVDGLRLKLEKHMRLVPSRPERDSAKFLEAERIVGRPDRNIVATGNVSLRQRGASIRADRVEYHADDQTAVALGNVVIEREGDTASGPRLTYRLADDTGEMDSPAFEFPRTGERRIATRGLAALARLEPGNVSRLFDAEYTSCPVPRDDWFLRVRELEIDSGRNVGTAHHTAVYFMGVPILYSPFLSFPLDNRRRTGFLAPTFGTSGRSGFDFAVPYYWNIAENLDATFTPKIYTRRGLQAGGEFRYLEPRFAGQLEGEFLPQDRLADADRYFAGVRHSHHLGRGWSAAVNAQKVSDDDYFRDLSTKISATSQTNLPRDAIVAYADDRWSFSARTLAYQTLQDPNGPPVPIPYRILPQLLLSGIEQNFHGFDWQVLADAANFRHPEKVNGQRAIVYPSITWPLRTSYGYVVPKVGYHYTRYALKENAEGLDERSHRSLPISSVDAGLFFERPFRWRGASFLQTLEPRLYYLNVPYRDQSRMPNFTTAESDFNFAQIFTESRFVGGDRIGDANQLTIALTTRLAESETGLERFKAALGQVYYFRPQRVTLEGGAPRDDKSSDLLALVESRMSPSVSFDAAWQYTPNLSRSQKINLGAHYSPRPGSIFNAAYRYARDTAERNIEQIDLSTQWPVGRDLSALARLNWSLEDRKLVEGLLGFEYNAGCWQLRAVAHRFITATQQYSTSFQIQLELTGLSRFGINPLETLRQNISGYRRSDEIVP